jgi:thioredoxin 1
MIEIDNEAELDRELKSNRRVLALFYASWCPYCRDFLRAFDGAVVNQKFDAVIRVNLDDYDNPLWDTCDVEAVPTVILFEDSKVYSRLDGRFGQGLRASEFKEWLEQLNK